MIARTRTVDGALITIKKSHSADRPVISGLQPVVAPFYDTRATADVLLAAIQAIGGDLATAVPYKDEVEYLQHYAFYEPPPPSTFTSLTPQQIATARQYPIELLIPFNRSGRATAWCHPDRHPSLSWYRKRNKATCFPCRQVYGPIDVLMFRDNLPFGEAVRRLL